MLSVTFCESENLVKMALEQNDICLIWTRGNNASFGGNLNPIDSARITSSPATLLKIKWQNNIGLSAWFATVNGVLLSSSTV